MSCETKDLMFVNGHLPITVSRERVFVCPPREFQYFFDTCSVPAELPGALIGQPLLSALDKSFIIGSEARGMYRKAIGKHNLSIAVGVPRRPEVLDADLDIEVNWEQIQNIVALGYSLKANKSPITGGICYSTKIAGQAEIDLHILNPGEHSLKKALLCAASPAMAIVAQINARQQTAKVLSPFNPVYLPGKQYCLPPIEGSLWDIPNTIAREFSDWRGFWFLTRRFMVGILSDPDFYQATADLAGGTKVWDSYKEQITKYLPLTSNEANILLDKFTRLSYSMWHSLHQPKTLALLSQSGVLEILIDSALNNFDGANARAIDGLHYLVSPKSPFGSVELIPLEKEIQVLKSFASH